MNLKKRGLALLMCICMIMTLLPVAAFADDAAVVYGQYENGEWAQDPNANGTVTSDNITLSKTAEPVPGSADTYKVDLKVVTTTTTTSVAPGSAATVLVIDVSGSMQTCATCNEASYWGYYYHADGCATGHSGEVIYDDSRMKSAVNAAISFLDSYKGDTSGVGRYVSLVSFSDSSSLKTDWIDVSTKDGYNSVVAALNSLRASGGTNTQAGLKTAKTQFDKQSVSAVAADARNTILLTDGIPTYGTYGHGNGTGNTKEISKDTQDAATSLKRSSKLYTVCFGAARDTVYLPDGGSDTCGNFLKNYVASNETGKTYAYNAGNTAELMNAFKAITDDITTGITSGLKVTDSAGKNIDMTAPSEYVSVENGYEWTLSDPVVTTDGNKTTYTYSVSYIVKLDTSAEGFEDGRYYPTNGETYLTYTDADGNEKTLNFEIPGVKGTAPRYTVTYNKGANGNLAGQDNDGNVVSSGIKIHSNTPAAPAVTPDEGYYFTGWDKEIAATVTADVTYTAQYSAKNEITVKANSLTVPYDGSEKSVSGFETLKFTVNGQNYTVEGLSASAKGTDAGTYPSVVKGTAVVKDANGNDVTKQFNVKTVDGYLKITPVTDEVTVTITGNHDSKVYTGSEQSVTGFTTDVGDKDITVALADGAKAEAKGTNVGNYKMGLKEADFNVTSKNYSNIKVVVVDGYLDITPVTDEVVVTITGNHESKVYNGSEQTVEGYTTDVGNKAINVALADGAKAEAKGVNVGNYQMGLTEDSFKVESDNYKNIKVVVVDGYLDITKAELPVGFTGESASKAYTGSEQEITGITAVGLLDGHTYAGLSYSAKGTAAGVYDGTFSGNLVIKDANGADVTENYIVTKTPGKLTITQTEAELKITANSNSWVYDGKDHADGGYTVTFGSEKYEVKAGESATLSTGDTVTAVVTKTVKHVSDTAEGNNVITKLTVSNEDSYKTVTKENGTLTIKAAPLTITAGSSSEPYVNGIVICNEYTNTPLVDGDKIASIKITGKQDGPGRSDNVPSDAVIKNAAGEDVTKDYDITYVNGVLEGIPILEKGEHFNYIMGYKDGTIRPNNNITRAEVATIFFRLFEDSSREYFWKETNDFTDISDTYWASPAISTLTNAGILKGFTDGTFRPNEPVTRAQMATIIARFAKLTDNKVTFNDIDGHWARESIELAAGNGWINGYEDGTFRPNNNITRAATMAMINRVLERHVENVEDLLPDMNVWIDNMDPSYTFYFDIQEATNFHECERIDNSPNEKWTAKLEDIDWTKYEF